MSKPSNPPAFPCSDIRNVKATGMTLRDYFAAKAMQKLMEDDMTVESGLSTSSYFIADSMLKEREKEQS